MTDTIKKEEIDQTYGYNDFLISYRSEKELDGTEKNVLDPIDNIGDAILEEASRKHPDADEIKKSGLLRTGDQLLRYGENGPWIVRRSVFTDTCSKLDLDESKNLYPFESEDEVRAFAAFSGKDVGDIWCKAKDGNGSEMTPWDLTTLAGLQEMKGTVAAIRAAKADPSKDASGLASKVDSGRLDKIEGDLNGRLQQVQETSFHEQPWYEKYWDGVLVGSGFATPAAVWFGAKALFSRFVGGAAGLMFFIKPPCDPQTGIFCGPGENPYQA